MIDFWRGNYGNCHLRRRRFATSGGYPNGRSEVTNDLAIGLRTDPEIAEVVKLAHARFGGEALGEVETKVEKQTYKFNQEEIDEIVQARYEEIFEAIAKELKASWGD